MSDNFRNVVLVTYDSLRADHCGSWGYDRNTTPTLDRMAEKGITFKSAIASASRTNPSMAGAFTGIPMVVQDRVDSPEHARHHLKRHGTFTERLSEMGYATGAFCPNAYASRYYGFDRGFDYYEDFLFDNTLYQNLFDKHVSKSSIYTTIRNVRNVIRRQEAFKTWDTYIDDIVDWVKTQDEPFFLWVFSLDTHFPYLTPKKHRQWSSLFDIYYYNWRCNQLIDQFEIDLSEQERRKIIDIYDDSISFGDALLAELQERLAAFNPVFIVHGDHGEAFGERGVYGHFYPSLHEENIHVPLVVANSGESATLNSPISLLELPEIVRRATGLEDAPVADINPDWALATDYDGRNERDLIAIRLQQMKLLLTNNGDETRTELYELSTDPEEQSNLIETEIPAKEPLATLATQRLAHENEIHAIRSAINELTPNGTDANSL